MLLNSIKTLFALVICIALAYWVEQHIGWQQVLASLAELTSTQVLLVFALLMLSQYLRGLRVFASFSFIPLENPPKHKDSVAVSLLHNAANFILPMRLGEVFLPLLAKTRLAIDVKTSSKTLLGLRLMDLYAVFFLLLLLQFVALAAFNKLLAVVLLAVFLIAPLLLPQIAKLAWLSWIYPPQFYKLKHIALLLAMTLVIWLLKAVILTYLLQLLIPSAIAVNHGASAVLMADLSAVLPVNGFASAGSYELAFALGAAGFNESGAVALSEVELAWMQAAVNLHIFLVVTNIVSALLGYYLLSFTARQSDHSKE